jgi:uncharacterized iron-regulated protein
MIKKGLLVFTIIIMTLSCMRQPREYTIYETETGKRVSLSNMARAAADFDVIVFGEFHGNDVIHKLQAKFLQEFLRNVEDAAVSMEMFERDVQTVLDRYLAGEIDEEVFLQEARAWSNYQTDYRPLIEYSKEERLPVIAANVPRRYASQVARFGLDWLGTIPPEERGYIAQEVTLTHDSYRDKFFGIMTDSRHIDDFSQAELEARLENLYASQSLKDDTMAESIVHFLSRRPQTKVVHFNGDFHSSGRLGVITKILRRQPELKVAVISPVTVGESESTRFNQDMRNIGDYVIVIKEYE